ncbi:uncharacterized protein LOC142531456 isoform X3 [Primulina tabacum]|uniref:uncharacterized protein LOC142531456 isoform X3 n=1 Tax=Primulina tabacum TaxID=48773 RepID=UPI003F594F2C
MLVTHWGLSGPVILRLSAWVARELSDSDYKGLLLVDFVPNLNIVEVKSVLCHHRNKFAKQKVINYFPPEFGLVKRFWRYLLEHEDIYGDLLWVSISNNSITAIASCVKHCSFCVIGKISLNTMQSRIQQHLFFAGEVLNIVGVTGGFNFQNAWSGGYVARTSIGNLATANMGGIDRVKSQVSAYLF